jgi:hypothetical protein
MKMHAKDEEHPGIAGEGWESLGAAPPQDTRGAEQKSEDLDRLAARVFGSEEGKKLLEWLRETYVEPAVCQPGASADFGFYREGQRFVVIDLEKRLTRATRPTNDSSSRSTSSRARRGARSRTGERSQVVATTGGVDIPF